MVHGDIMQVDLAGEQFDFILMECVFSILDGKSAVFGRLRRLLRPGGWIGITDVTVSAPLPQELQGLVATVGCVGDALSLGEYGDLITKEGFVLEHQRDCQDVARAFLADVHSKILMAEIASKLGKLRIGDRVIADVQQLFELARDLVAQRVLELRLAGGSQA